MEHVGKFDDAEVTALSRGPTRRGTLNRKGRLYKERICTRIRPRCPNEFPTRQDATGIRMYSRLSLSRLPERDVRYSYGFGLLCSRVGCVACGIREAQVHPGTVSNSADPVMGAERDAHCDCSRASLKEILFRSARSIEEPAMRYKL